MSKRVMIMAGEHSGEMHGAHLARALRGILPDCTMFGMGGEKMRSAGVDVFLDITKKHTIGFLSNIFLLLTNLPTLISLILKVRSIFKNRPPDILVLIDNQGLNVFLASLAKMYRVRTVYYIPPQEWLWGTLKGGQKVASVVDKIISIFKNEHEFYKELHPNAEYFGHPLMDIIPSRFVNNTQDVKDSNTVGIFPGSRSSELTRMAPVLKDIAIELYNNDNNLRFLVAVAGDKYRNEVMALFENVPFPVEFVEKNSHEVIAKSKLILGTAGTLSLECAILQTPMIVIYKVSQLDYFLAKKILKIDLDYVSMPNIVINEMVFPEFIQDDIKIDNIKSVAFKMLRDNDFYEEFLKKTTQIRSHLGQPGVVDKVAGSIAKELEC